MNLSNRLLGYLTWDTKHKTQTLQKCPQRSQTDAGTVQHYKEGKATKTPRCKISWHVFFPADWQVSEPDETKRTDATWGHFFARILACYKPKESFTLTNHQFRTLTQDADEFLPAFSNRVYKEAQHCNNKCKNDDCTAKETAIRGQIIIETR